MQLDTINKMSEIVERDYGAYVKPVKQIVVDIKLIAALLHELAMERYLKEPL